MTLCNDSHSAVLQGTEKNMLFTKQLASAYLISHFGLGIVKKFLSGVHSADKFPHRFTHKMETRQLGNRQIWVKFLIVYFIFACVILAHTYPESFWINL